MTETQTGAGFRFHQTIPILRIFDEAKAREFYLDFLGFTLNWEYRVTPAHPLYAEISRAGLVLHLSEHHGDATPGATVFVRMEGLSALHEDLASRPYACAKPGIEKQEWGREIVVTDPFGNRIRFCQNEGQHEG